LDDKRIKEIIEIQEKLHLTVGRKRKKMAIGIYPLEKISLPIRFKALEPDKIKFVPLESKREMSGLEILQKHPAGKEYSHLLAGKIKFPIFVDDKKNILSMPPIINSRLTGKITNKTKEVFIECSGFDFEILEKSLNIIVTSLAEMGGKIYQMDLKGMKGKVVKSRTPNLDSEKIGLKIENAEKLLGIQLSEKDVKKLLGKMGIDYEKGFAKIPAWRVDILHEVDLIEDIAIAYGYDNFIPEIPDISTIGKEDIKESIKRKISELLSGLGMIEILNHHLTNKENQLSKMGLKDKELKKVFEIKESKTESDLLRSNLTHQALKVLSENIDSEYPQKLFEIGKVFEEKNTQIKEIEKLSCAVSPGGFTEIKQTLEYFFKMIGLEKDLEIVEFANQENTKHFIEGRSAEIKFKGKDIGLIGEIHPKILKNWRIKMPVALFEIELDDILEELEN
jgi:phenylalanyl-tRNA synthetase beta chain